jgi:cation transport regulator ChaC
MGNALWLSSARARCGAPTSACIQQKVIRTLGHERLARANPQSRTVQGGDAPCQGIAFDFPDAHQREVEAYLSDRETCHASNIDIHLSDTEITARTYIYDGPRLIEDALSLRTRARMILMAEGIAGSSFDYVSNVRDHLEQLGVSDPAVDELWNAVVAVRDGDRDE